MSNKKKSESMTNDGKTVKIFDQKDGSTRFRIQFDITYKGTKGKKVEGESHTVPDMTMHLSQLLERHSSGKDVPMKQPIFVQTEIPVFNDLTDVEKYRESLQRRTEEVNAFIKEEQDRQDQEELKKLREKKKRQKSQMDLVDEAEKADRAKRDQAADQEEEA